MIRCQLRLGRWQDALADVERCDVVIADSPYGEGTHKATNDHISGSKLPDGVDRMSIDYDHWTPDDVREWVGHWSQVCQGWLCCMTSDDLAPHFRMAYRAARLYDFAPIPIIQPRPRLVGDGPSSWTVWLMVARPKTREFATWGCLPGAYYSHTDRTGIVAGAKPLDLMRAVVRDYSRPGNLVVDTHAGGGTTLLAARLEGRRAIGAEMDPETHAKATARLGRMPAPTEKQPVLPGLEAAE